MEIPQAQADTFHNTSQLPKNHGFSINAGEASLSGTTQMEDTQGNFNQVLLEEPTEQEDDLCIPVSIDRAVPGGVMKVNSLISAN